MAKKAKKEKKKKYNPMSYVKLTKPGSYTSPYESQLNAARDQILNFKYDPMSDANYQALAKIYGARGNQAAQDTLADAASLNGGYGTSYAVSAAQQARNQYNQELAALIPDLEANAFSRLQTNYNTLMDADTAAYGRYRDQMADYQWGKGLDMDLYQYKETQKNSGGSGGSGGRRSSGGSGGSGGGYTGSNSGGMPITREDFNNILKKPSNNGYAGAYKTNGKSYAGASGVSNKTLSPGAFNQKVNEKKKK